MVRGLAVGFALLVAVWQASSPAMARMSTTLDLQRVTDPPVAADASPVSAGRSIGRFAVAGPLITACSQADGPLSAAPPTGQARVVAISYCLLLRRAPDGAGLAYWTAQLEAGLSPVRLVDRLIESPEYQARGVRSYRSSLAALTPTGDSPVAPDPQPEAGQDGVLRPRTEISADRFRDWVTARIPGQADAVTPALLHGASSDGGQQINVAYVHLSATRGVSVSPGDRRSATVGTWAREIGAHVAINGNWYAPWDGPAVSGGEVYGGSDHFYTALLGFTAEGDAIIEHHREVADGVDGRIREGVSGHPTLIHRGRATTDFGRDPTFTARHPRTAIGLDETGDVLILVTVDGRRASARGMTGAETASLMAELGAHDALMLDGGGSTTMWIVGKGVVNRPSGSLRSVGNQLAVYGD